MKINVKTTFHQKDKKYVHSDLRENLKAAFQHYPLLSYYYLVSFYSHPLFWHKYRQKAKHSSDYCRKRKEKRRGGGGEYNANGGLKSFFSHIYSFVCLFIFKKKLTDHTRLIHKGVYHTCDLCSYKSPWKGHLTRHKKLIHKIFDTKENILQPELTPQ